MRKLIALTLAVLALTSLCAMAEAENAAARCSETLTGSWVCLSDAGSGLVPQSFVYPSETLLLTGSDSGAVYLTKYDEDMSVGGEITFSADGGALVWAIAENGRVYFCVYRKLVTSDGDAPSPVGTWAATDEYGEIELSFHEDGTVLITAYNPKRVEARWTLRDAEIVIMTNIPGFEECVCPYDGSGIDLSSMGSDVIARRQ